MVEKIKAAGSIFIILLLFPYVAVMLAGGWTGKNAYGQEISGEGEAAEAWEDLEEWVLEILPAQMPVTYEREALKAQAVLIRSSLAYHLQQEQLSPQQVDAKKLEEWELPHYSPLELEEIWGEALFEEYYGKILQAIQETKGQVLTWQGSYVDLPYHAVSAGRTREGSLLGDAYPYLRVAECPGDLEAEDFLQIIKLELWETPERSFGSGKICPPAVLPCRSSRRGNGWPLPRVWAMALGSACTRRSFRLARERHIWKF